MKLAARSFPGEFLFTTEEGVRDLLRQATSLQSDMEGVLMPIVVHIDVELAKRKMSVGEFAERVGITPANVAVLKNGRARRSASAPWTQCAGCWTARRATCSSGSPTALPPKALAPKGRRSREVVDHTPRCGAGGGCFRAWWRR